ncbi:hypothetical protein [Oceanospirillum sp.]|uniref:hypothetical protein n=1 Tax=Oceanospirillum sp. TaxID=2021254 RepID=UPI003A8FF1DC
MLNTSHYFGRFLSPSNTATTGAQNTSSPSESVRQAVQSARENTKAQAQELGVESVARLVPVDNATYNDLFHGEQKVKADALLERMSPEQRDFITSNIGDYVSLLKDDDIYQLAENLSDEEVSQFTDIMIAMQSEDPWGIRVTNDLDYIHIRDVMQTLADSRPALRRQILDQAHAYAEQVQPYTEQVQPREKPSTYNRKELFPRPQNKNSSMDNLVTFLSTLHNTKDHQSLMNNLDSVDETQKIPLMQVYILDEELGVRSYEILKNKAFSPEAKEGLLQFIAETADKTRHFFDLKIGANNSSNPNDSKAASVAWLDNHSYSIGRDMVKDTLDLLDNYEFSDEQLLNMTGTLNNLDRSNQRAYLEITVQGMEHLFGSDYLEPLDLTEHSDALAAIDAVRNNAEARDLVFMSRLGDLSRPAGKTGDATYFVKEKGAEPYKDMAETAEVLVANAWLGQRKLAPDIWPPESGEYETPPLNKDTLTMVRQLNQLSAKERDLSVDRLYVFGDLTRGALDIR